MVFKFRYNLPMNNIKRNKHVKKILLVVMDGQFKSDTQSLEDFVHCKVTESQRLFIIHLAARFWTILRRAQSFAVWGFHTTQAYSMHGLAMLWYATSFACAEHPNIASSTQNNLVIRYRFNASSHLRSRVRALASSFQHASTSTITHANKLTRLSRLASNKHLCKLILLELKRFNQECIVLDTSEF